MCDNVDIISHNNYQRCTEVVLCDNVNIISHNNYQRCTEVVCVIM